MRLGFLALGGICVYFTAKELFPGRMNPNSLFSEAFEKLRYNEDVIRMAGDSMKAFGRDVGRSTEGRRNHIDSYEYKAEDGSKRTRIRFNIKGDKAKVLVWAEVCICYKINSSCLFFHYNSFLDYHTNDTSHIPSSHLAPRTCSVFPDCR